MSKNFRQIIYSNWRAYRSDKISMIGTSHLYETLSSAMRLQLFHMWKKWFNSMKRSSRLYMNLLSNEGCLSIGAVGCTTTNNEFSSLCHVFN